MSTDTVKRYAKRDIIALDQAGGYCRHVFALTSESLHGKSNIAAELGHRDMQIDTLATRLAVYDAETDAAIDAAKDRP